MTNKLVRKIKRVYAKQRKNFYQALLPREAQKRILFIVGCQRSGTTLMYRIFYKDLNAKCYGEFSVLSSQDKLKRLRLNPLDIVSKEFGKVRAPFIVLKPLVESQNLPKLLDYFDDSKAMWMFRHYKDVAASNLARFGSENGIDDIRPIVNNEPGNWRSEHLSGDVRETITKYFSEDMNLHDAAVLFWYARNSLFFDLGLDNAPRVFMCKYHDLVMQPGLMMRSVYEHIGQPYPGDMIIRDVHAQSLKKGRAILLSPEVEALADAMMTRLDAAYENKNPVTLPNR